MLEGDQKLSALSHFIVENKDKKIIVYFLTGAMVDYFWKVFKRTRSPSWNIFRYLLCYPSIRKRMSFLFMGRSLQTKEKAFFLDFEPWKLVFFFVISCYLMRLGVLFCTDVAARGLDFKEHPIDTVVQYLFYFHCVFHLQIWPSSRSLLLRSSNWSNRTCWFLRERTFIPNAEWGGVHR